MRIFFSVNALNNLTMKTLNNLREDPWNCAEMNWRDSGIGSVATLSATYNFNWNMLVRSLVVDDFKYRDKVVIGTCNYGEISVLWTRDILNTKVHSDGTRRHETSNWSEKKRSNFSCYWGMYVWSWGTRLVKQLVHDIASPRVLFDADFAMDRLQKLNELGDSENLALSSLVPMMSVWQR
jgi:hypothetical protein